MSMLRVPPTAAAGSNVVFLSLFCLSLIVRDLFYPSFSCPYERSRLAWVDHKPALLASSGPTYPLRGWGIVDERRAETGDRVASTRPPSRENLAMLRVLVLQTAAATWRVLDTSVCLLFSLGS